jgi:uroporphyrinogen III methyltransferase/synthase
VKVNQNKTCAGKVFLVGAGPGDPELITVKARYCLSTADVVVYDRLVSREIFLMAPQTAEIIYVGKKPGYHARPQDQINEVLRVKALEGKKVVRLKGGDPFVFGRGGEEALYLAEHGVPFEIIPGITSGIAAAAYAGIPMTHRDWTSSVAFITGHKAPGKSLDAPDWNKIGTSIGTIVIYMGLKNLVEITEQIIESGRDPETPAAAIHWGTTPFQKTVISDLKNIAEQVSNADLNSPIILLIGDVVRLRDTIQWYETKPLFGRQLLVIHEHPQSTDLVSHLRILGAGVFESKVFGKIPGWDQFILSPELMNIFTEIDKYAWIVFTSVIAVEMFFANLFRLKKDARSLTNTHIACLDPFVADKVKEFGILPDLICNPDIPEETYTHLFTQLENKNRKILFVQIGDLLPQHIKLPESHEPDIEMVYLHPEEYPAVNNEAIREEIEDGNVDGVVFTSPVSVDHFAKLMKIRNFEHLPDTTALFCFCANTVKKVTIHNGQVAAEACEPDLSALSDAIVQYFTRIVHYK